jgi:endonuclease YncB( thermonuclease family)
MPSIFTDAIGRRAGRSRNPWWIVLLVALAGWVYNQYFKSQPRSRDRTANRQTEKRTGNRRSSPQAPGMPLEPGGKVVRDTVVKVYDGDTVTLRRMGSVRLIGADTPEKAQPGGVDAGNFTRETLLGKNVEVEVCSRQPHDRYGRWLAFVYYREGNNRVLFNSELVRQGYARTLSVKPCSIDEEVWNGYADEARRGRRGLYATLGEVPDAASYRKAKRLRH